MADVIKIKNVDRNTAFPIELIVAKLRAVDKYSSLQKDIASRDILKLSNNLADRIASNDTINAISFQRYLEETLRNEYEKWPSYAQELRLYFIECITPEVLPENVSTEVRRLYGMKR